MVIVFRKRDPLNWATDNAQQKQIEFQENRMLGVKLFLSIIACYNICFMQSSHKKAC